MKALFILISISVCLSTLAQKTFIKYYPQITDTAGVPLKKEIKEQYQGFIQNADTIKDGAYSSFYSFSGQLKSKGEYRQNKLSGEWIDYYQNGDIKWKRAYNAFGHLEGEEQFFDHRGNLQYTATYTAETVVDNNHSYRFEKLYPNKQLAAEAKIRNTDFHGEFKEFYRDGQLMAISHYENGKRVGTFKVMDKSGQLLQKGNYCDGKICDTLTTFHPNGTVKSKGKFANNLPNGFMYEYFPNQQLKRVSFFKNDTLNGECLRYYANGQLESRSFFNMGHIDGDFIAYHPNGTKNLEYRYTYGLKQGPYEEYDSLGRIVRKVKYKNDKLDGECLTFYPNGNIKQKFQYDLGERVGLQLTFYPDNTLQKRENLQDIHHPLKIEEFQEDGILNRQELYEYKKEVDPSTGQLAENAYKVLKLFNINGKLIAQYNYLNHWKHGEHVEYYDNGRKKSEEFFKFDHLHNQRKHYEKSGDLKAMEHYVSGKKQGLTILYDKGRKIEEINYRRDKKHGDYKKYNQKEVMLEKGTYFNGKMHGKWTYFDKKGTVIKKEEYKKGALIVNEN